MVKMQKIPASLSRLLSVSMLSLLSFLAACGGGGGGGGEAAIPVTNPSTNTSTNAATEPIPPLVVSNYLASSEEYAAFNLLNSERDRCGFGKLNQNLQLDAAAKAHADYQILNRLVTHVEETFNLGFSGKTPSDRVIAKGYLSAGGVTDEIVAYEGTATKTGLGANGIRGLLGAPYHLRGLMGGYREVGLSVRSSSDLGTSPPSAYLQINAAYKASQGSQLLGSTEVNTYPCQGTTGVNSRLNNESPNPIPGRDLGTNPLGSVVYVAVREGQVLKITSAVMIQLSTGQAVSLRTPITAANDPYAPCQEGCFKPHQAYFAADGPLQVNAGYQVLINGSNNDVAFSRVFTFTTGSNV